MKNYENRNVIHKNFEKGKVISSYVNEKNNRLVLVIKFDALNTNRNIYADFYGTHVF